MQTQSNVINKKVLQFDWQKTSEVSRARKQSIVTN